MKSNSLVVLCKMSSNTGKHSGAFLLWLLLPSLANSIVLWDDIHALVSNHLIALDKYPGVRPIRIGESSHRIVGKPVCSA